jgi:hypothetical protein
VKWSTIETRAYTCVEKVAVHRVVAVAMWFEIVDGEDELGFALPRIETSNDFREALFGRWTPGRKFLGPLQVDAIIMAGREIKITSADRSIPSRAGVCFGKIPDEVGVVGWNEDARHCADVAGGEPWEDHASDEK